ncbi:MAG: GTP 3',8-cyclase MoaA [Thermodesulfobacteriota bacterium]
MPPSGNHAVLAATSPLRDNHGREINYLRLAVTDRCNLRCQYCMPEGGVDFVEHREILTLEELLRVARVFAAMGVGKVRITGGEPFARRDIMVLIRELAATRGIDRLHITTNGVAAAEHLPELKALGIAGINLSLDTLDPRRFWAITRRDALPQVLQTLETTLALAIPLKINTVVLDTTPDTDILAIAALARTTALTVRFIERMPFSGGNSGRGGSPVLRQRLMTLFPGLEPEPTSAATTARLFTLTGFAGRIGLIEGYSRTFCRTCNKVRLTPKGMLKTCLYDDGVLDLKGMIRAGASDAAIAAAVAAALRRRFVDGHQAEGACRGGDEPSMASIGG